MDYNVVLSVDLRSVCHTYTLFYLINDLQLQGCCFENFIFFLLSFIFLVALRGLNSTWSSENFLTVCVLFFLLSFILTVFKLELSTQGGGIGGRPPLPVECSLRDRFEEVRGGQIQSVGVNFGPKQAVFQPTFEPSFQLNRLMGNMWGGGFKTWF